jgi:hypothetical protein
MLVFVVIGEVSIKTIDSFHFGVTVEFSFTMSYFAASQSFVYYNRFPSLPGTCAAIIVSFSRGLIVILLFFAFKAKVSEL